MDQEDKDVDESMGLFEAAFHARHVELSQPQIKHIAVLHDDSDQDPTVSLLALATKELFGASLTDIPAPVLGMDAAEKVALLRQSSEEMDLVFIPAPFGEDIGSLKTQSLSSVVDLFLTEARVPTFVVRQPMEEPKSLLHSPVVLLDWQARFQGIAASFACLFAGKNGSVDLLATIDPTTMTEMEALLGGDKDDMATFRTLVRRAETRLSGGIVSAVQNLESEIGFDCRFSVQEGVNSARACANQAHENNGFAICAYLSETGSPSLNRLRDLILESQQPVLCLPI